PLLSTSPLSTSTSYAHRHPPHLHSFPTRRSSDLHPGELRVRTVHVVTRSAGTAEPTGHQGMQDHGIARDDVRNGRADLTHPTGRSEEHTSELQSRFDLVCRLLLEKKKNNYAHQPP